MMRSIHPPGFSAFASAKQQSPTGHLDSSLAIQQDAGAQDQTADCLDVDGS